MIFQDKYQQIELYKEVSKETIQEMLDLIKKEQVWIFGAGHFADMILTMIKTLAPDFRPSGIIVTSAERNPKELSGVPVYDIDYFKEGTDSPVIIATREEFQREIFNTLWKKGFHKLIPISYAHFNRLAEIYYDKCFERAFGRLDILESMNLRHYIKSHFTDKQEFLSDMVGNVWNEMYRLATEESAKYAMENMLDAVCYDHATPMLTDMIMRGGDGLYIEFGVADGGTSNYMGRLRRDQIIYGFDSFEGMPEDFYSSLTHVRKGDIVQSKIPDAEPNVVFVKGLFQDTLENFLEEHDEDVAFIRLDCAIYSAASYALDKIATRLRKGSLIMINLYYNYPGWNKIGEYKAFHEMIDKYGLKYKYLAYCATEFQVTVEIL